MSNWLEEKRKEIERLLLQESFASQDGKRIAKWMIEVAENSYKQGQADMQSKLDEAIRLHTDEFNRRKQAELDLWKYKHKHDLKVDDVIEFVYSSENCIHNWEFTRKIRAIDYKNEIIHFYEKIDIEEFARNSRYKYGVCLKAKDYEIDIKRVLK